MALVMARLRAPTEQRVVGTWSIEPTEAHCVPSPIPSLSPEPGESTHLFMLADRRPPKSPNKTDFLSVNQNYCLQKHACTSPRMHPKLELCVHIPALG